jgi:hypothetical protein
VSCVGGAHYCIVALYGMEATESVRKKASDVSLWDIKGYYGFGCGEMW